MTSSSITPIPDDTSEYFAIRRLSEQTHVGTSTLRAWERRYGLLKPERTPKGHRLYSQKDVERVLKIVDLLKDGHSLPNIAEILSVQSQPEQILAQQESESDIVNSTDTWNNLVSKTLDAVSDFSHERIEAIFNESSSLYPVQLVIEKLIEPVLQNLGNKWRDHPESGIAEEHFYSSWLKNRLGARFHHAYAHARGTRIICACAPGNFHEIGLMLFAIMALSRGYRVLYFGADLPFNQLDYIVQRSAAKAIVLTAFDNKNRVAQDGLSLLLKTIEVPVFMGGHYYSQVGKRFEHDGGILLGQNTTIALNVFERHIPVY